MDPDGNGDEKSFFQKLVNLYNLQARVDQIVTGAEKTDARFSLTEEMIKGLHRIAMYKLLDEAGEYRKTSVKINSSSHVPPNWIEIPALMGTLCAYINENWENRDLIHLSAFCLWRLNWIHPFLNGNGRTARALSYLVMCLRHGKILPAKNTVHQQIVAIKSEYSAKLGQADIIYASTGSID